MKKFIVLFLLVISIICDVLLSIDNIYLRKVINANAQFSEKTTNVISVVDTLYGRKYIIDIDTITGYAKIIGLKNSIVVE